MKIFTNITAGHPEKLVKPVIYTILANVIGMLPFGLAIGAIQIIFQPFGTPGVPLDTGRLWIVVGGLVLSMVIMFLAEIPAYRHAYRDAYMTAAEGRANLAEHMRKLPLGYLFCKDAGMLGNMMMGILPW